MKRLTSIVVFLRFAIRTVVAPRLGGVRSASTTHPAKRVGEGSFKENWLSDAGAYPVIFIISFAGLFCFGVGSRCLLQNPDVRITPKRRNAIIRDWEN